MWIVLQSFLPCLEHLSVCEQACKHSNTHTLIYCPLHIVWIVSLHVSLSPSFTDVFIPLFSLNWGPLEIWTNCFYLRVPCVCVCVWGVSTELLLSGSLLTLYLLFSTLSYILHFSLSLQIPLISEPQPLSNILLLNYLPHHILLQTNI